MFHETINTQEAITCFHSLMHPNSQKRILRLSGDANMGKSHLLTKVFPLVAQKDGQVRYAILDLRYQIDNQPRAVPDFLHSACGLLGQSCDCYYTEYQNWLNRPKTVGVQRLLALFSHINISLKDSSFDLQDRDRNLTRKFVEDLSKLDDKPLLLLFDHVDKATPQIQTWLMDTLLVQLSPLRHVRVIIAGRQLPEASSSYVACCQSYTLHPVTEVEAYIEYCRKINVILVDQSIKDFAKAHDYRPGAFVELVVPKFILQKVPHE